MQKSEIMEDTRNIMQDLLARNASEDEIDTHLQKMIDIYDDTYHNEKDNQLGIDDYDSDFYDNLKEIVG